MKIQMDTSKMEHLEEKSYYNHNYYKCGNWDSVLLEECDEYYQALTYWIIDDDGHKTLLGCGGMHGAIEFLTMYT